MEFVRLHNKDEKYFNESWELYNRDFSKKEKVTQQNLNKVLKY